MSQAEPRHDAQELRETESYLFGRDLLGRLHLALAVVGAIVAGVLLGEAWLLWTGIVLMALLCLRTAVVLNRKEADLRRFRDEQLEPPSDGGS